LDKEVENTYKILYYFLFIEIHEFILMWDQHI